MSDDPQRAPLVDPPNAEGLNSVLARNISLLRRKRDEAQRSASREEKLAGAITCFSGSMLFVYVHMVAVGLWVAINVGIVPHAPVFDPSFVILATVASVEAIFLSTFVLISQNRSAVEADRRADLDLQISLLTEHELTRLGGLLAQVADHLGVPAAADPEIRELRRDVAPEKVLDEIESDRAAGSR